MFPRGRASRLHGIHLIDGHHGPQEKLLVRISFADPRAQLINRGHLRLLLQLLGALRQPDSNLHLGVQRHHPVPQFDRLPSRKVVSMIVSAVTVSPG
jgi:hypothetical protein